MKQFVAVLFGIAILHAQTVTLYKPDGTTWTGTLPPHPRVMIDATNKARLEDPDGDGAGVAPIIGSNKDYILAAVAALHSTAQSYINDPKNQSKELLITSLGYYMDHNASFSGSHRACTGGKLDGSVSDLVTDSNGTYHDCYKWYALDLLKNWTRNRPDSGSCQNVVSKCGTEANTALEDEQYYGDNMFWTATAYSIMRSSLTAPERMAFAQQMLNGALPPDGVFPACNNRVKETPTLSGTFRYTAASSLDCRGRYGSNQTPYTAQWTGETLPSDLAGKFIYFHPKTGETTFQNQSSVTVTTTAYKASQSACWNESGVKITPATTTYNIGSTVLTFSTPQSGKCIASIEMLTRNGSFGYVQSVNPGANSFTFDSCGYRRDQDNVMYIIDTPATSTDCGYVLTGVHGGNNPQYQGQANFVGYTVGAITPSTTSIQVTTTTGLPVPPFRAFINRQEDVKVTAINGNILTVVRGLSDTIARAWDTNTLFEWRHGGNNNTLDPYGWVNRNMTKQQMFMSSAIAYTDEIPAAAELLEKASEFWYNNTEIAQNKYHGLLTGAALTYSITRVWHHSAYITQMLDAISGGQVNYRAEWMRRGMGLALPMLQTPWDPIRFLIYGQVSTSCRYINNGECLEPLLAAQDMVRGSTEAKYAWHLAYSSGVVTNPGLLSDTSFRGLLSILFFCDGTETALDWKTALPTHYVDRGANPASPDTGLNFAMSRTSWTDPNATMATFAAPDGFGEKWIDVPEGSYSIAKKDDYFFGGNNGSSFAWQYSVGAANFFNILELQNQVVIGNPTSRQKSQGTNPDPIHDADFPQSFDKVLTDDSTPGGGKYVYIRADTKGSQGSLGFTVNRKYRHFLHFKPTGGSEAFVVYDDTGLSSPGLIRLQLPYNNNGEVNTIRNHTEGYTDLSADGKQVVSTSWTGLHKMVTDLIKGGTQYVSDLNATYASGTLTLCYDCTPTHPSRVVAGGQTWVYSAPMTAKFTVVTNGDWFFWVDPTDGTVHGAPKTGYTMTSCSAGIDCSGGAISDFPANAIRIAQINNKSGACVGVGASAYGGTNGTRPYHCRDYTAEHAVLISDGYAATASEFLVTHQIVPVGDTAPAAAEIITINPNFAGVQIAGSSPKVAIFGKGTTSALFSEASFTSTHSGTAQYIVAGLSAGGYDIRRGGTLVTTATVTDATGAIYWEGTSGAYTITANGQAPTLVIATASLPGGVTGTAYSQTLQATGGTTPYTWSISAGALPTGLSLNASTGAITGTPTVANTFTFTARVQDAQIASATRDLSITITAAVIPTITTAALPDGVVGQAYSAQLTCANCSGSTWSVISGSLPTSITLDTASGALTGTPTVAGDFPFAIGLTGAAAKSLQITIASAPIPPSYLTVAVIPISGSATVMYSGVADYNASCVVSVIDGDQNEVASLTQPTGPPKRRAYLSGLVPETQYTAQVDCGSQSGSIGFGTLPINLARISLPVRIAPTIGDEVRVEWGYSASGNDQTPITQACSGSCTITIPSVRRNALVRMQFVYRAAGADLKTTDPLFVEIQ